MASPSFHEFRRQASFFLKETIKAARLALTDVTPAELLIEEATGEDSRAPDTPTMGLISRAAFEVDDYWRIVEILHKRLCKFDKENWRASYKALVILEHLLTHGPERVSEEFQCDKEVIKEMSIFKYFDDKGFDWGSRVREKSKRILTLLHEDRSFLKQERSKARKVTSDIKGFGRANPSRLVNESPMSNYGNTDDGLDNDKQEKHSGFENMETIDYFHPFYERGQDKASYSLLLS